jgi:phosphoserine phosphatase
MERTAVFDIDKTLTRAFLIAPIMAAEEQAGLLQTGTYEAAVHLLQAVKAGDLPYEDAAGQMLTLRSLIKRSAGRRASRARP